MARLTIGERTRGAVLLGALVVVSSCAAEQASRRDDDPMRAGDPNAAPSVGALPEMVREPPDMAERMRPALTMVNEILARKLPEPPADRSYESLSAWVDGAVTPWVEQRREAIDDVRFQLQRSEPTVADGVLGAVVVGMLQEDTALELERIPAPAELDSEPQVATMFRDIIRVQARPFVNSALQHYVQCANTGYRATEEFQRFARFCHARHDRLRETYDSDDSEVARSSP